MNNANKAIPAPAPTNMTTAGTAREIVEASKAVGTFGVKVLGRPRIGVSPLNIYWIIPNNVRMVAAIRNGTVIDVAVLDGDTVIYDGRSWQDGLDAVRNYIAGSPQ